MAIYRRIIISIAVFAIVAIISYLGYSIVSKTTEKRETQKRISELSAFSFEDLNGNEFSNQNLKLNTNTILINFNSTCDLCQHEAQSIVEHVELFNDSQVLFISPESVELIKQFEKDYKLINQNNINLLHDPTNLFTRKLGATAYPYLLIYDKNQNLIKRHKGQLNAPAIAKIIKQHYTVK